MARTEYGLIPALDVTDLDRAVELARRVGENPFVHAFKVGFSLGLGYGLPAVAEALGRVTDKPLIYDHQKAGTDIPATGTLFARTLRDAGIDTAILFPQAGPETLRGWVEALCEEGLEVIVGGIMTHPGYLVSEGGFIADDAVVRMYATARDLGVTRFVVPLTKPEAVKGLYDAAGFDDTCTFYSPGYGAQGGDVRAFSFLRRHELIVGRSLLNAADPEAAIHDLQLQLERSA